MSSGGRLGCAPGMRKLAAGLFGCLLIVVPIAVVAQTGGAGAAGWTGGDIVVRAVLVILAAVLPAAILIGRGVVRRARLDTVERLEAALTGARIETDSASFAIVKDRYSDERAEADRLWPYALPILIYVGISFCGFYSAFVMAASDGPWAKANMLLAGLAAPGEAGFGDLQRRSAAVVTFAFFGAYVWSVQFLIRRIANYDLSAISFLRVAVHTIFACFTVGAIWHLGSGLGGFLGDGAILPLAFVVGFAPTLGLAALMRRFPQLQAKRLDPKTATLSPIMPLTMIDGIDWFIAFRLGEHEIEDVQNLAAANPFELFASTPYGLYQVIDWIAQAQLLVAVGPARVERLRELNVRNLRDLAGLRAQPALRMAAQKALLGDALGAADDVTLFDTALATVSDDLYSRRIEQIWRVLAERYDHQAQAANVVRLAARAAE
jgi:hypothetical protein